MGPRMRKALHGPSRPYPSLERSSPSLDMPTSLSKYSFVSPVDVETRMLSSDCVLETVQKPP